MCPWVKFPDKFWFPIFGAVTLFLLCGMAGETSESGCSLSGSGSLFWIIVLTPCSPHCIFMMLLKLIFMVVPNLGLFPDMLTDFLSFHLYIQLQDFVSNNHRSLVIHFLFSRYLSPLVPVLTFWNFSHFSISLLGKGDREDHAYILYSLNLHYSICRHMITELAKVSGRSWWLCHIRNK